MAAIEAFFLGITIHTAEQKIAQAEIDAVIGRDRLPTFADRERLPYCEALCLEIMRRYTLGPLGELIFQTHPLVFVLMILCLRMDVRASTRLAQGRRA